MAGWRATERCPMRRIYLILTLALALTFGLVLLLAPANAPVRAEVPTSQPQITLSFAPVVKATAPSVVNIFTTTVPQRQSPFTQDPFFQQFFQGIGRSTPEEQNALGSGVIVSSDGIILSNNHVVDGATEIRVVLNDRREYPAEVMLADPDVDLAVLKLKGAHDLPALKFDDSDALQVGDLVLAIGNPFGVGQTVSSGIISGLARSALQVGNGKGYYVQTDAPINPGNSGGALVDMAGGLIGLNTAILTQGGGSEGIGFAIPSNLAAAFVKQAEAGAKRFAKPWAGITAQDVDAASADSLGLPQPEGVLVADLDPASPFATAGLATGDVILTLSGAPVNTPQEMNYRLAILGAGGKAPVTWLHAGAQKSAEVALIPPPDDPPRQTLTINDNVLLRGATLSRINPAVRAEMDLPADAEGVVVVDAQDYAAQVGLQPGDILQAINNTAIAIPQDALKATRQRISLWQFDLIRQGQHLRLRFRI
jgi:Do/DeqQ family serine protease